jgi:hypothetical protein
LELTSIQQANYWGIETEQQAGEDTGNQIENEFHGGIQVLVSDLLFNFDFNAAF